jgi:hypothetical protein
MIIVQSYIESFFIDYFIFMVSTLLIDLFREVMLGLISSKVTFIMFGSSGAAVEFFYGTGTDDLWFYDFLDFCINYFI